MLAKPKSVTANAAIADVEDFVVRSLSSPAMSIDEEDWVMGDLVKVKAEERVCARRRFRNLQEPCRAKRREVPKSVFKAIGVAVELVNDTVVAFLLGAGNVVDSRIDELTRQLGSTEVKVVSFTAKLFDSEETRHKARQKHKDHLKKVRTVEKTSEEHIVAELDGDLSWYHGVLLSIQEIIMTANERNAE